MLAEFPTKRLLSERLQALAKELGLDRTEIGALAEELGIKTPVDRLNKTDLQELVRTLAARARGPVDGAPPVGVGGPPPGFDPDKVPPYRPKPPPPIDGTDPDLGGLPPPEPPKPRPPRYPYTVADGVAIACRRGVLAPGDEVLASDLSLDPEQAEIALAQHVTAGRVVKKRPRRKARRPARK